MQKLRKKYVEPMSAEEIRRVTIERAPEYADAPMEIFEKIHREQLESESWINDVYHVLRRRIKGNEGCPDMVYLSIKRHDKDVISSGTRWRDFQAIKNQLVGEECEGVELYPAESRLVDTANQYHLWCIESPEFRFPLGFNDGRVVLDGTGEIDEASNTRQAPLDS